MHVKQVKGASDEYGYYSYSAYSGSDKIIISPDGKFVCLYGNGAGILYDKELGTQKNIYQSEYYSEEKVNALFLDNNNLTFYNNGLKLFKVDPEFGGVEEVWESVNRPYLSITDGIENKLISINDIEKLADTVALVNEINSTFDKIKNSTELFSSGKKDYYLEIVSSLNKRLGKLTRYKHQDYLYTLIKINFYKNTKDKIDQKVDYKKSEERILEITDYILANSDSFEKLDSSSVAIIFSELAWAKFFTRDFDGALNMATKSFTYDATQNIVFKNLALGYLLSKDFSNAEYYYRELKDTDFEDIYLFDNNLIYNYYGTLNSETPLFKDIFIQDLNVLEKAGVISAEDQDLIKIRKLLTN